MSSKLIDYMENMGDRARATGLPFSSYERKPSLSAAHFTRLAVPGTGIVATPLGPVHSHRYDGNSICHARIEKVEKRFSRGFTILASYTWSKNIGDHRAICNLD